MLKRGPFGENICEIHLFDLKCARKLFKTMVVKKGRLEENSKES